MGAVWQVADEKFALHDAPRVRAGPCTSAQVQAWERAREDTAERARQPVMLGGLEPGEPRHSSMGVWERMARLAWFQPLEHDRWPPRVLAPRGHG